MVRTKMFVFAAALVLGAGSALAGAPEPAGKVDAAKITAALDEMVQNGSLVGVSALVTQNGKEAYFGAFGYADREAAKPMARDTIVQLFSMTKPITGVALMQLWEQGKFRLDDPVAKYIPEFKDVQVFDGLDADGKPILVPVERQMTIRDLTRHTAGLTYCNKADNVPEVVAQCQTIEPMKIEETLDQFAQKLGTLPLEYQPGEKWRYSFASDVEALLVQRISGEPFDKYLEEHVFKPLGMTHTGFFVPPEQRGKLSAMYYWHQDGSYSRIPDAQAFRLNTAHWPLTPGGYGLTSTLDDYSRFAQMLVNGGALDGVRILQPWTVRMMSTNQLDPAVTDRIWLNTGKGEVGWGVNVAVRLDPPSKPDENAGEVGEYFWDGFANTLFWVDPKNKLTAVLFTQYQPFGKVPLHKAFRDAVYQGVDPAALAPTQ